MPKLIEAQSSDEEDIRIPKKNTRNRIVSSDSESDYYDGSDCDCDESALPDVFRELELEEERNPEGSPQQKSTIQSTAWSEFTGRQKSFAFVEENQLSLPPLDMTPYNVFQLFVDEEIIEMIVTQTNKYALQKLDNATLSQGARMSKWKPTNSAEMKKFLGLLLWMGLVKVNPVANYWSKNTLYNFKLPSTVMSRNRFEILLSNLHFTDNTSISPKDRQGKIINLMDKLQEKYQKVYTPGENIVIDETLIPWRGRLIFRQYIPSKAHKYGIKMFKLCSSEGFTWASKIYSGKSSEGIRETGLAHNVCIKLAEKLFEKGRTLYVDNFYTSYELALTCLDRKTHLVGTLRHNKKSMPRDVLDCKLKKGEMIAKEDDKWHIANSSVKNVKHLMRIECFVTV